VGKIVTGDTAREVLGKGGAIKVGQHEGPLRRPVEAAAKGLDDWSPRSRKTPADFRSETHSEGRV